jgi:DNA-directed RNA polymerase specialized sigma24 family protein
MATALLHFVRHLTPPSATDHALLERFAATRDQDAFSELVRRHGPIVYRMCRRLVGSTAADDAFQATFLVLATRIAAAKAAGSIGSWLVGVAGRVARQIDSPRDKSKKNELLLIVTAEIVPAKP